MPKEPRKTVAQNRKARHDFFIDEVFEAGMELFGTEVKSIRLGKCNMRDCYAVIQSGQLVVQGLHISPYEKGNVYNRDPMRPKRLLMHKSEIRKLGQEVMTRGMALVPLSIYLKGGRMKLELGLCRGKKLYDKRQDIKQRDDRREMERHFRESTRA